MSAVIYRVSAIYRQGIFQWAESLGGWSDKRKVSLLEKERWVA